MLLPELSSSGPELEVESSEVVGELDVEEVRSPDDVGRSVELVPTGAPVVPLEPDSVAASIEPPESSPAQPTMRLTSMMSVERIRDEGHHVNAVAR